VSEIEFVTLINPSVFSSAEEFEGLLTQIWDEIQEVIDYVKGSFYLLDPVIKSIYVLEPFISEDKEELDAILTQRIQLKDIEAKGLVKVFWCLIFSSVESSCFIKF